MHTPFPRFSIIFLLAAALLLSACQIPIPYLAPFPDIEQASDQGDSGGGTQPDTAQSETASIADEASSDENETESEASEMPKGTGEATATIVVSSLRMRSGPGVDYEIVGAAPAGEQFPLLGQTSGCQWLNVDHPTLGNVWLSGSPQFTSITVDCEQVAEIDAPALPTSQPAEESVAEGAPTPTITPAAPPAAPEQSAEEAALPSDLGCYLFQNFVGPELNVTVTAVDWEWNDNFLVPEGGERPYCFGPGRYTITVDAPPPWNDLNTEINVHAGEHFLFPVEGRK